MEIGQEGEATCTMVFASVRDDGTGWVISILASDNETIECECMDRKSSSVVSVPHKAGTEEWRVAWDACQGAVLRSPYEHIIWDGVFVPYKESHMGGRIFHQRENIDRY